MYKNSLYLFLLGMLNYFFWKYFNSTCFKVASLHYKLLTNSNPVTLWCCMFCLFTVNRLFWFSSISLFNSYFILFSEFAINTVSFEYHMLLRLYLYGEMKVEIQIAVQVCVRDLVGRTLDWVASFVFRSTVVYLALVASDQMQLFLCIH